MRLIPKWMCVFLRGRLAKRKPKFNTNPFLGGLFTRTFGSEREANTKLSTCCVPLVSSLAWLSKLRACFFQVETSRAVKYPPKKPWLKPVFVDICGSIIIPGVLGGVHSGYYILTALLGTPPERSVRLNPMSA